MTDAELELRIKTALPKNIVQPRRSPVYVGFRCHQCCGFCYYRNRLHESMFSLPLIRQQVSYIFDYGITDVEITGGEPSEYPELRELCLMIRKEGMARGFIPRIAVITNGGLATRWSECGDLIDEVLLSYHSGRDPKDRKMFPRGSTWDMAERMSDCANLGGKLLRTNTVLGKFNIQDWESILEDIIRLSPRIANILPVNIFDGARAMEAEMDIPGQREMIRLAVDRLEKNGIEVFVRYFPFCGLEGCERNLVGHLQHIWDWFDWNRELDGVKVLDLSRRKADLGKYGSTSISAALRIRNAVNTKPSKCYLCKYWPICDGFEKTTNGNAAEFVKPVEGQYIYNPLQFLDQRSYRLYSRFVYNKSLLG